MSAVKAALEHALASAEDHLGGVERGYENAKDRLRHYELAIVAAREAVVEIKEALTQYE